MKLFSAFRKPGWQSADARIRAAAVADDTDPDLLARLPALALEDPDPQVRRQALRRCADPALHARAMRSEQDPEIRAWARQQWLEAVASGAAAAPDPATLDRADLEELAVSASDPQLRGRCLEHIQRPGFLAERVINETDAGLRQALLTRIDDSDQLERIAGQLRRRDRRLHQLARERAQALRLASGDPQARQAQAQTLCAQLEQLMRTPLERDDKARQLAACLQQWQQLSPDSLPQALQVRCQGLVEVIQAQLQPPPQADMATAADGAGTDEGPAAAAPPPAPTPEEIAAQAQLEAALARNAAEIAREQELAAQRARHEREQRARQAALLDELAKHLEAGDLAGARQQLADLQPETLTGAAQRRWQALQPRLRELQGWESWANNKVRARLCAEVERLVGSGLHPDAISHRINEVREQWRQLDQQEGRDETSPPSGLDQRLRAACARALKPAREFFDKRQALREELMQKVRCFLADAERQLGQDSAAAEAAEPAAASGEVATGSTRADDTADTVQPSAAGGAAPAVDPVAGLLSLQRTAIQHLRGLDPLAPHQRKRLASRLRRLLDTVKPRLEAAFAQAEAARQTLIMEAEKLAGENDGRQLARQARRLQERWQAVGKGRRSRDQQQWRQFRTAIDQAFARLDQQRAEHKAALEQRRQEAAAVVAELEQLAALEGKALQESPATVRALRERWQALELADRALAERYDEALTRHRLALQDLAREQARARLQRLLEQGRSDHTGASLPASLQRARALVFEAEALCELPPPDDQREARRLWQLERLQAHMSGELPAEEKQDRPARLEQLLQQWTALTGLAAADHDQFVARLRLAIDSL